MTPDKRGLLQPLLFACLLTAGAVALQAHPAGAAETTFEGVRAEAARGGYRLITTDELWKLYDEEPSDLLLVDTRQDWEHRAGHIAGSVSFPMEPTWWSRLTSRRALRKILGPDRDTLLVFY